MRKFIDMTGQRFGLLFVLEKGKSLSSSGAYWKCKCDCGKEAIVSRCHLIQAHTISCGCHKEKVLYLGLNRIHGKSNCHDRTYKTWQEMRQRCSNPNKHNYKWYGGKGITVCSRWDTFENFLQDMGERPLGMTLDRINSNYNYCPDNCRWATQEIQSRDVKTQPRDKNNRWVAK